jgi:hypothetical protein
MDLSAARGAMIETGLLGNPAILLEARAFIGFLLLCPSWAANAGIKYISSPCQTLLAEISNSPGDLLGCIHGIQFTVDLA